MAPASPVAKMFGFGPKTIAVTGANGFIGSHCVVALLKAGFDVVAVGKFLCLDRTKNQSLRRLSRFCSNNMHSSCALL